MKSSGFNSFQGWGVAAACGCINLLTQVPMRLAGLLFVAMIHRYDTNRELASWPFVICLIMRCAPGPLTAYLGDYIGLRNLTILGTVMSVIGLGLCYFAEDIMTVAILFGAVYGLGLSFANTLMPQILKQYFDTNLAIANGVVFAASCLGAVLFSPLLQVLLNTYGLSGSFLIMCGIMLNGIPISFLCREPDNKKKPPVDLANIADKSKGQYSVVPVIDCEARFDDSSNNIENGKAAYTTVPLILSDSGRLPVNTSNAIEEDELACEEIRLVNPSEVKIVLTKNRKNSEFEQRTEVYASTTENIEKNSKCGECLKPLVLFKDPLFVVILVAHGAMAFAANVNYTVLVDISRDKGIEESNEIYFVMALPAAELTGYLCLGWVTDKGFLSNANYIAACIMCFAIGCCDLVWSTDFYSMLAGVLMIGVCAAGVGTAFPGLIYEFIEEDKQAMAIASRLMLFTPLSFTTAPLIGYFRGTLGSYNGLLYLLGGINLVCALLIAIMPCIARLKTKKKQITRSEMT